MTSCYNGLRALNTYVQYCLTSLAQGLVDVKSTQPSRLVDHQRTTAEQKCLLTYHIQ